MERDTTITYRPLEEWTYDELITLEDQLRGGWNHVDEIDFDAMRTGDPSDGFGAAPNYGDWLEHHLTALDRILTEAGYRKVPCARGGWRRSTQRLRVIGSEAFATAVGRADG